MYRLRIIALWLAAIVAAAMYGQTGSISRATPESQGVSSAQVKLYFDSLLAIPQTDMHAVMVLRHGKVIAEMYPGPFGPQYRHTLYSASKTFTAAAVGLAVQDNRLRLTDRVATFFPDLLPDSVSDALADMTVRDLLTMTSGVKPDWTMRSKRPDWVRGFLEKPVCDPGSEFQYDSMVTYMLSAIVTRATGHTVLDLLNQHLFTPMGITEAAWEVSPEGYNTGGWGLHIDPEGMAKFGQLLLDRGVYEGRQLLPAEWVDAMTTKQTEAREHGYGYQTWPCEYPGAYRADGALGQYIIVCPDKDMVVVITEATLGNGVPPRTYTWRLMDTVSDSPLPADDKAYNTLSRASNAVLPLPKGKARSAMASAIDGRRIELGDNPFGWEAITFESGKDTLRALITDRSGYSYTLDLGYRHWLTSATDAYPPYSITPIGRFTGLEGPYYVSGAYAWASKDSLDITIHYVNWVTSLHLHLTVAQDGTLELTVDTNYSRNPIRIKAA